MKRSFLIFQDSDNNDYLLLSNFEKNEKIAIDFTQDIITINDIPKYYQKGEKRFKLRFDYHSDGHIIRHEEFYNYLDNLDKDFKNSNAKEVDSLINNKLINKEKLNIIYAGRRSNENEIIKTNVYFIIPVSIDTVELNNFLTKKLDFTVLNKHLNDEFKSEMINQKLLGTPEEFTELNIYNNQLKVIKEYFKDCPSEWEFFNQFTKKDD